MDFYIFNFFIKDLECLVAGQQNITFSLTIN